MPAEGLDKSSHFDTLQDVELLTDEADHGGEADVGSGSHLESLAGAVPGRLVRVVLLGVAAAATDANGDAKDADAATGARRLLVLGIDGAGGRGADGDLVAEARGDDELADAGEGLDVFGSVAAELVLGRVDVPAKREGISGWAFLMYGTSMLPRGMQ